jgi:NAD+ synthase
MAGINTYYIYEEVISWLQTRKDSGCRGVVLGLSGGKDSTVVAMLAVKVWGKENVHGLIMPNRNWDDVDDARTVAKTLGITYTIQSIKNAYSSIGDNFYVSPQAATNIAPRLRMTTLYAYAQTHGFWVIGTGNRSERYIGWCTKFGDMGCDFNPIAHLTCGEVINLGLVLAEQFGLDPRLITRPPADGLTGKTDEDNFGFTYEQLDTYILTGTSGNEEIDEKIDKMHKAAIHKLIMPATI